MAAVRNYIAGPTVVADAEKLKQVFVNILDNAIDAFDGVPENRRIELFIENGGSNAVVRVRDNGARHPARQARPHLQPVLHHQGERHRASAWRSRRRSSRRTPARSRSISEPGRGTEFVVTLPLPPK